MKTVNVTREHARKPRDTLRENPRATARDPARRTKCFGAGSGFSSRFQPPQRLECVRYRKGIAIQWLLYLLISASDDFSSEFLFRGDEAE